MRTQKVSVKGAKRNSRAEPLKAALDSSSAGAKAVSAGKKGSAAVKVHPTSAQNKPTVKAKGSTVVNSQVKAVATDGSTT